ncbi:renalase-like isoform X1 [Macrobrachium nipponense]|uniref:renalase-like isoform X1 n=3 Tax=Macrobrachium nipponense TaxID=159736 RepID=UPI0030C88951
MGSQEPIMMTRVLLVGGGLTNAVTGSLLRRELPHVELILWDKARGAGGRMATSRNPQDGKTSVDLGAQYISATPEYSKLHSAYYEELIGAGILAPLTSHIEGMRETGEHTNHYVTPQGVSSIVKHFMKSANMDVRYGHHVNRIDLSGNKWNVETKEGAADTFDAVVLTMPVPQLFGLAGTVKDTLENDEKLRSSLLSVDYSSRYALGLFYDEGADIKLKNEVSAEYITNDSVIRFVAIDNKKRGLDNGAPSVVVHTSVPFGKAYVEETTDDVKPLIMKKVQELFPEWPEPTYVKCQKWRFSQVTSAYPGLPGCVSLADGLVIGGDGFTHSNMDGCIESAKSIVDVVVQYLKKGS